MEIKIEELEKARRKAILREWFEDKKQKVCCWAMNNKELLMVAIPGVIGASTAMIKAVGKHENIKKEQEVKDLYCYDRSLGHYWKLRRELTNSEWTQIDKRKANGERMANILEELKVLK